MADIFDFLEDEDIEDEDEMTDETDEEAEAEDDDEDVEIIPYEYGIDFDTGQLTGEIVSGSEAVKVWAWLALQTVRYRYLIYSWDYGCEVESLIGAQYSEEFTAARAEKMITDCLAENQYIEGISDFDVLFEGDSLKISFAIETSYGEEELTLNV